MLVSTLYTASIEQSHVAEARDEVFEYASQSQYVVVTGATARRCTRAAAEVSELRLGVGCTVPLVSTGTPASPVNGQHPYACLCDQAPMAHGARHAAVYPALLRSRPMCKRLSAADARPTCYGKSFSSWANATAGTQLQRARLQRIRCPSVPKLGLTIPRDSRDQGVSTTARRVTFAPEDPEGASTCGAARREVGDSLIYIPATS